MEMNWYVIFDNSGDSRTTLIEHYQSPDESIETTRLFQKLSVALQRGNAALFNNRVPHQSFHADIL